MNPTVSARLLYVFNLKDCLSVISTMSDQYKRIKAGTLAQQREILAEIRGKQALSNTCIVRFHTKPSPLAVALHGCQRLLQEDGEEGGLQGTLPGHLKF